MKHTKKAHLRPSKFWLTLAAGLLSLGLSADVDAKRKKRGKRKNRSSLVTNAANVKALGELMGEFKFGMSKEDILKTLKKNVDASYKDQIAATTDTYAQDALRQKKVKEVKRIEDSFVKFEGKKSGWDVSVVDDQFAHETDESMMVYWENDPETGKNQRRFFFLSSGKLYKMAIALQGSMLQQDQRTFSYFRSLMERRYGKGADKNVEKRTGAKVLVGAEWNAKNFHVTALDKLAFYDTFVLVIASPQVEASVEEKRKALRKAPKRNAVIDAVLEKDGDTPSLDSGKSAIEDAIKK